MSDFLNNDRTTRFGWDETFMNLALLVSQRTSCKHHLVGVVYVDKNKRIVSLGYNGPVSGDYNCIEVGCAKIDGDPVTKKVQKCRGMHAEINGIINSENTARLQGATLYTSVLCCWDCFKAISNAGIKEVVYFQEYKRIKKGGEATEEENEIWDLGKKLGIKIRKYDGEVHLKDTKYNKREK